jgi:hypothetical protein
LPRRHGGVQFFPLLFGKGVQFQHILFPFFPVGFLPGLNAGGFGFPFFPAALELILNVAQTVFYGFLDYLDLFFP